MFHYLKLSQSLSGYGLDYMTFTNAQGVKQTLGISSTGFQVFDGQVGGGSNFVPKAAFAWNAIQGFKVDDDLVLVNFKDAGQPAFKGQLSDKKEAKRIVNAMKGYSELNKRKALPMSSVTQELKVICRPTPFLSLAEIRLG